MSTRDVLGLYYIIYYINIRLEIAPLELFSFLFFFSSVCGVPSLMDHVHYSQSSQKIM